jgi:glucose/arabinose dehydrogenase
MRIRVVANAFALLMLLSADSAVSYPGFVAQFASQYGSTPGACQQCHVNAGGNDPWNAFGRDLLANGGLVGETGNIIPALLAVELLNSDLVAGNNLAEILAGTQPGWCDPANQACVNQGYLQNGSVQGPATPPSGVPLDDAPPGDPEPNLELSLASVNFGFVLLGASEERAISITNSGQVDLVVSVSISGDADLAVAVGPASPVPPGGSTIVVVRFAPLLAGPASAMLTIASNDPGTPVVSLDVLGEGVTQLPPPPEFAQCPVGSRLDDPIGGPITQGAIGVALETIATGFVNPVFGVSAPNDASRLFVLDQPGQVWAIDLATRTKTVFLDVSADLVGPLGLFGIGFDERGLLGLAFHPDYFSNGLLYTYQSMPADEVADFTTLPPGVLPDHQGTLIEWLVLDPGSPSSTVFPFSDREILRIDEPQFNHNGGALVFDEDELLYISVGDGGAADDEGDGHSPQGNGQDTGNVLGTILRIDPLDDNSLSRQYGIPSDNPFAPANATQSLGGQLGCNDGFCDEIWAYGFRNPWRMSFDTAGNNTLVVGDVGQNDIEEVDIVEKGRNYGWRIKEGSFCFDRNADESGFVTDQTFQGPPALTDPVAEYNHDEGLSVTGGFVYRGEIDELDGHYVFGDWAPGFTDPVPGRLFYLAMPEIQDPDQANEIREFRLLGANDVGSKINGFGQDANGELYVIGSSLGLLIGNTGSVQKIVPEPDGLLLLGSGICMLCACANDRRRKRGHRSRGESGSGSRRLKLHDDEGIFPS